MCGIVAIYSKSDHITASQFRRFVTLLENTETRGKDATGYSYIQDGELIVEKKDEKASDFCKKIPLKPMKTKVIIGHCRAKTQGSEKKMVNNHPIIYNDLSLVHNGCIQNDHILFGDSELKLKRNGEVDSEIIPAMIDHFLKTKPIEEAIEEAHKKINGVCACIMIEKNSPGKMWVWRNTNPVYILETPTEFLITSTKEIMETLKDVPKESTVIDTPINDLFKFDGNEVTHLPDKIKPRVVVSYGRNYTCGSGVGGSYGSYGRDESFHGYVYLNGYFK